VTDGRTDGRTELRWLRRAESIAAFARKKTIVAEWGKVPQRLVDRAIGQWRRRLGCVAQQQS